MGCWFLRCPRPLGSFSLTVSLWKLSRLSLSLIFWCFVITYFLSYKGCSPWSCINLHIQTLSQSCHFPDLPTYLLPPHWVLLGSTRWAHSPWPCSPSLGGWVAAHPLSSRGSALPHPLCSRPHHCHVCQLHSFSICPSGIIHCQTWLSLQKRVEVSTWV